MLPLLIPLIVIWFAALGELGKMAFGLLEWLFGLFQDSPDQVRHKEWARRQQIRTELWQNAQEEYDQRRQVRRTTQRAKSRHNAALRHRRKSAIYEQIQAKKAERNNLGAEMSNLYNLGVSMEKDGQHSRAEINRIFNKIAAIKARKIELCNEINDLYTNMHEE